ncbi:MAG: cobalt-precorrin-6Y C(15)-methyltransferase, partial [Methanogenium sp.]|nr:cobalt-precorrin-6Y C(15)-methyltransferase [Methanogenium sp.]
SGAKNIELITGEASEILKRVENPDCAFIGGSGNIETVLEILMRKGCKRVVINAVLLNTVTKAVNTLKKLGIFEEVVHVQVSSSYTLAGDIMLKPKNPVYIIVGRTK